MSKRKTAGSAALSVLLSATLAVSPALSVPAYAENESGGGSSISEIDGDSSNNESSESLTSSKTKETPSEPDNTSQPEVNVLSGDGITDTGNDETAGNNAAPQTTENVVSIGNDNYASLEDAVSNAKDGDTVVVNNDIALTAPVSIDKNLTLNLNGHAITSDGNVTSLLVAKTGCTLTITNGTASSVGSISGGTTAAVMAQGTVRLESGKISSDIRGVLANGEGSAFSMSGGEVYGKKEAVRGQRASVELTNGYIHSDSDPLVLLASTGTVSGEARLEGYYGVTLYNMTSDNQIDNAEGATPSKFEMTGGSITCTVFAISGNNTQSATCSATISGGTITAEDTAIYWPMEGELTIEGGSITGGNAIEAKMGTITITNGTLTGTEEYAFGYSGNGSFSDGAAIKLVGQVYGASEGQFINSPELVVNITGGTLNSTHGNAVSVYRSNQTTAYGGGELSAKITVSDEAQLSPADGKDGIRVTSDESDFTVSDNTVTTGSTTITNEALAQAAVVSTGTTQTGASSSKATNTLYSSIAQALSDAEPQATITLLRDVDEDVVVPSGSDVTLDLGKHTLTGSVTGDGTLEIKNGTFEGQASGGNISVDDDSVTNVVAKIGNDGYKTVAAAIEAANNGSTITLAANVTESITIPANKTITLDLAGYTITNTDSKDTITNNGTLTVEDSVGSGVVDNVSHGKAALSTAEGSSTTLNGGTFKRSKEAGTLDYATGNSSANGNSYYTIVNHGELTINDGTTVELLLSDGTPAGHSSIIDNGWFSGAPSQPGYNATLTINGGVIKGGKYIKNDSYGTLVVNGGQLLEGANASILNWNTATITGGTLDPCDNAAGIVYNIKWTDAEKGSVDITNGTFVTTGSQQVVFSDPEDSTNFSSDAEISGGTFQGNAPSEDYIVPGAGLNQNQDGSYGVHQHQLVEFAAQDPTCTDAGHSHYWQCSVCNKVFTDADGTSETDADAVVIPAKGHSLAHFEAVAPTGTTDGNIEYWQCTVCHKYFSDAEGKNEIDPSNVIDPAIKHTVTLVYGHGLANGTMQVPDGAVLTDLTDPSYPGWTFVGWFTTRAEDGTVSGEYQFGQPITEDVTLYAGWIENGSTNKTPVSPQDSENNNSQNAEVNTAGLAQTSDPTVVAPIVAASVAGIAAVAGAVTVRKRSR